MIRRSLFHSACLIPLAVSLLTASTHRAQAQDAPTPSAQLNSLEQAHYAAEWAADPASATTAGIHRYDTRLNDVSSAALQRATARLHKERKALVALDVSSLPQRRQDDRDVLVAAIDHELLTAERIQPWQHMPDAYVSLATNALYGLIDRDFAPLPVRMKDVIARERQIPAMLALAEKQLTTVPAVFIEIAKEDLGGTFSFVGENVPMAFSSVKDPALQTALKRSTARTLTALKHFQQFLGNIKPSGSFALGAQTMQAMLATDLVALPLDEVIAAGRAQLKKDQADFLAVEHEVDPTHPDQALNLIRQDHPAADALNQTVRDQLHDSQRFVLKQALVTLPNTTLPTVIDTPTFERSLLTAATDWPGPFETKATTSFYFVTPIDKTLSARQQKEALEDFNRPALLNITVHEAMPGHFVQGLYLRAHPDWTLTRKAAQSYATTEGWAHYTEQMMVEQGFKAHDPKLHLAQLQDALLRDCRFLAAFGMHAKGMSLKEATAMMEHECYQSSVSAYKEARRGTADPGYYAYTLGKLMILKLRADEEKAEGSTFSLKAFHDAFLNAGLVPVGIIRKEMTGHTAPLL